MTDASYHDNPPVVDHCQLEQRHCIAHEYIETPYKITIGDTCALIAETCPLLNIGMRAFQP